MKLSKRSIPISLFGTLAIASMSHECFAIGISPGSTTTSSLGSTANAIVRIANPVGLASGTVVQIVPESGGVDIDVLTADHVLRNESSGNTLYGPSLINISFGNIGGGGASFTANQLGTDFTIPSGGSSSVDLGIINIFVPTNKLGTLPANLEAVALPTAIPAAGTAITQAGYGLRTTIALVTSPQNPGGKLSYVYSPNYSLGQGYGILTAGPNSIGGAGVTTITGAASADTGHSYVYQGYQNEAQIGNSSPDFASSTSYIFPGDSGGPSLSGNTILGVHSSASFGSISGDSSSFFAYAASSNFQWQDVSVANNLPWINNELATLASTPEPATAALIQVVFTIIASRRMRRRPTPSLQLASS